MNPEEIIDFEEALRIASEMVAVKASGLRGAIHRKELPYFKFGRRLRFKRSDLLAWIEAKSTH